MPVVLPSHVARPLGREPDLVDSLSVIDNELVEWILHARPGDDDEKKQMRRVLALRTRLEQDLNKLVLERLRLSPTGLEKQVLRLNAVSEQICGTAKSIGTAKDVLNAAEEVVTIAAQALAYAKNPI
jgi:hypothetical protein